MPQILVTVIFSKFTTLEYKIVFICIITYKHVIDVDLYRIE